MINCSQVTDYRRGRIALQEFFMFAYSVAGKPSKTTQAKINHLLELIYDDQSKTIQDCHENFCGEGCHECDMISKLGPLEYIAWRDRGTVQEWLRQPLPQSVCEMYFIKTSKGGLGKYTKWDEMLDWVENALAFNDLDRLLREMSIEELEKIPGVAYKTSRFFILHSRNFANCIPLDTHILRFLRDIGYNETPTKTPGSETVYLYWERKAIEAFNFKSKYAVDKSRGKGWSLAQWDLETWKEYSGNFEDPKDAHKNKILTT